MTKRNQKLFDILANAVIYDTKAGRLYIATGKYAGHTVVITKNGVTIK